MIISDKGNVFLPENPAEAHADMVMAIREYRKSLKERLGDEEAEKRFDYMLESAKRPDEETLALALDKLLTDINKCLREKDGE
jgi:hypothetical protein